MSTAAFITAVPNLHLRRHNDDDWKFRNSLKKPNSFLLSAFLRKFFNFVKSAFQMLSLHSVFSKLTCYLDLILVSVLGKRNPHSFLFSPA